AVVAEALHFLVLHVDLEQAHGGLVGIVLDDDGGVLAVLLQDGLASAGVLLGGKDNGVVAGPTEARHAARSRGEGPRLAACGVEEPDLRFRALLVGPGARLTLRLRQWPTAEERDVRAVRRPARR